jgi:hypothetical protein
LLNACLASLIVAAILCLPTAALTQSATSEKVYEVLLKANPEVGKQKDFVVAYSDKLMERLRSLDGFVSVMDGRETKICNLLCQSHVASAFYRGETVKALDLVRYVFTSTCYGVLNDPEHRGKALKDLEDVAQSSYLRNPTELAKSEEDSYILRHILGDALKAWEPNFTKVTAFPRLKKLWEAGYPTDPTRTNSPPIISPIEKAAQYTACRKVL